MSCVLENDLTKEDLINRFGINVINNEIYGASGQKLKYHLIGGKYKKYWSVMVYDRENKIKVPRKIKYTLKDGSKAEYDSYSYKVTALAVHRILYIWANGVQHAGMVIDHIDNDPYNNDLSNLQEISPAENVTKNMKYSDRLMKFNLSKSSAYYEEKLNKFLDDCERAKLNRDANEVHLIRCKINQVRAKIRAAKAYEEGLYELPDDQKAMLEKRRMKEEMKAEIKHWHDLYTESGCMNAEYRAKWKEAIKKSRGEI